MRRSRLRSRFSKGLADLRCCATASRAFKARDLSGVRLVTMFLDAIYLPVRPSGAKAGVLCSSGVAETGERVLLAVCLGMGSETPGLFVRP